MPRTDLTGYFVVLTRASFLPVKHLHPHHNPTPVSVPSQTHSYPRLSQLVRLLTGNPLPDLTPPLLWLEPSLDQTKAVQPGNHCPTEAKTLLVSHQARIEGTFVHHGREGHRRSRSICMVPMEGGLPIPFHRGQSSLQHVLESLRSF